MSEGSERTIEFLQSFADLVDPRQQAKVFTNPGQGASPQGA